MRAAISRRSRLRAAFRTRHTIQNVNARNMANSIKTSATAQVILVTFSRFGGFTYRMLVPGLLANVIGNHLRGANNAYSNSQIVADCSYR